MKVKASFSVEAALVIPFMFLIIVFIIRLALFFCDCCMAEAFLYGELVNGTVKESFFVSEYAEKHIKTENSHMKAEAVLRMKGFMPETIGTRKISVAVALDKSVANAHTARAVRKLIENLNMIKKGDY